MNERGAMVNGNEGGKTEIANSEKNFRPTAILSVRNPTRRGPGFNGDRSANNCPRQSTKLS